MPKSNSPPTAVTAGSVKDKRYYQQVEKVLLSFDSIEEWADYISFLSKLQKALQLNELKASSPILPYSSQVAHRLSLCLSSNLPNGVHQKTLSLYDSIFTAIPNSTLDSQIHVWLPGLLPLSSFCSVQIKPLLIQLFNTHILNKLSQPTIKLITKPLILSFLPGLDDEGSETFSEFLSLMDKLKKKLGDDKHFWQSIFLCIINNPERRLGSLYWCNKRLPVFTKFKGVDEFSEEASVCILPDPGLLIRAFASSITSTVSMIAANDIIVVRGFFDLLLSHLPLDSDVLTTIALKSDRELLVKSCCSITLKKDMSLNRRLWNWLLGPEIDHAHVQKSDDTIGKSSSASSRSEFFVKHGFQTLSTILLQQIKECSTIDQFLIIVKLSISLILDKWEISRMISPILFLPIMRATYNFRDSADTILATARSFFDTVEAMYIWNEINRLICANKEMNLVEFIVNEFDLNEDEMRNTHIPLGIVGLQENAFSSKTLSIFETLLENATLSTIPEVNPEHNELKEITKSDILQYYDDLLLDHSTSPPFTNEEISIRILSNLKFIVISNFESYDFKISSKLCDLYTHLVSKVSDRDLIEKMLTITESPMDRVKGQKNCKNFEKENLFSAFNIVKLLTIVHLSLTPIEKDSMLKKIMSNYYYSLISPYPSNYQVEVVKSIFQLDKYYQKHQIEAAIIKLFINTNSIFEKVRALSNLWNHSLNFNDNDSILSRPLFLVLDELTEVNDELVAAKFISSNILKGGSSNRLLKFLTNPLLSFDFIFDNSNELKIDDDLGQFSYYLSTIINVIKTDEKHIKECFNNELVVMDNTDKLNAISTNSWNVSTYKSLMLNIIEKFLRLKLVEDVFEDACAEFMNRYYQATTSCLNLYRLLITGNETDFVSKLNMIIETSNKISETSTRDSSGYFELIVDKYLQCVLKLLKISEDQNVTLNLLHLENDEKDPPLVRFIISVIKNAQTVVLIESWITLLRRSLYIFNESVFSVILTLNDAVVFKIDKLFKLLKENTDNEKESEEVVFLNDIESSLNVLASGIEDLLTISHSYLLTSSLRAAREAGSGSNSIAGTVSNTPGFFGNVIQGVFQLESPAIRTTEENKKYSILLALQDAMAIGSKIWMWAECSSNKLDSSSHVRSSTAIYLSRKLKFRARKLLETLVDLERQECLESLVSLNFQVNSKETTKLLHVLDGGRSQVTLPNIFNSILTRCYPSVLDEKQKSTLSSDVSTKILSKFLVEYIQSIDEDSLGDIWTFTYQFFKEVVAHPIAFKEVIPEFMKANTIIMCKLSNSKFGEQGRYRRDMGDLFMKLLMIAVRGEAVSDEWRSANFEVALKETRESPPFNSDLVSSGDDSTPILKEKAIATQSELLETLTLILTRLGEFISDADKVTSCINTILINLVSPQLKHKRIYEIPLQTISLISLIGKTHPTKAWRAVVLECFMDNSFFKTSTTNLSQWEEIVHIWIDGDKERLGELVTKVNPIISSSAANIFNWGEGSEIENKVFNLKRIIFIFMIKPKDFFLTNLEELLSRIESAFNSNVNDNVICPPSYKSEILLLLRIVTLKFSELHLLSHWTLLSNEILSEFQQLIEEKNSKELIQLSSQELKVILFNCKLLDQLLLLKFDEFNLNEWLFVNSNPEVVTVPSITSGSSNYITSCVDRISLEKDLFVSSKDPVVNLNTRFEDGVYVKPLLAGIKTVDSLSSLRLFFNSLSLLHYERTFGLKSADLEACELDILNDVVSE